MPIFFLHLSRNTDNFLVIQDELKFGSHFRFWNLISAKTTNLFLADTQFWIAHTSRLKKKMGVDWERDIVLLV